MVPILAFLGFLQIAGFAVVLRVLRIRFDHTERRIGEMLHAVRVVLADHARARATHPDMVSEAARDREGAHQRAAHRNGAD
jgi:hypothetical protein